ncbi:MAG: hypothetical protein EBU96_09415 [Actinobacteria bacterium]|nr:hypothetical protein [Actinomycetota bacterium]
MTNLGGVMQPMDMTNLNYIGPLVATPDNRVMNMGNSGYGMSQQECQMRMSSANNLGGGVQDIASTFGIIDMFLGKR